MLKVFLNLTGRSSENVLLRLKLRSSGYDTMLTTHMSERIS